MEKLGNGSITEVEAKRFLRREQPFPPMGKQKVAKLPSLLTVVAVTETTSGLISTLAPTQNVRFVAWAASVLGMPLDTPIETLSKLLIERGHTLTDREALYVAERTVRGEPTRMRTDGNANFYFKANRDGSVSVGYVSIDGLLHVRESSLSNNNVWNASRRLLVRNVDSSIL